MIPNEVLYLLHPLYQKAIQNLEEEWKNCEDAKSKMDLLIDFSNNFLMLPQLWSKLFRLSEAENSLNEREEILKKAYFQFCYVDENSPGFTSHRLLNQELDFSHSDEHLNIYELSELNEMVKDFKYPHKNMDASLRFYKEYISSPIKADILNQFKKYKKLYDEIMASEDDLTLWFENIIRVSDEKFIANNIEYRIGKNLNTLDLWKMYIEYLKSSSSNPKKLLILYSKYCRYFTNDKIMKEEYEKATKIYGPSYVNWKNKFDFETHFEGSNQRIEIPVKSDQIQTLPLLQPIIKGKFQNFQIQIFTLPNTIMNYLLQDYNIFQKLCKTCKYFFAVNRIPVFHNFICKSLPWKEGVEFNEESVAVMFPGRQKKYPKNAMIKFDHKFIVSNSLNVTNHINSNILSSSVIPNMFRCCAKFIRLENQNLTIKEFEILTENNTVEMLYLNEIRIYKNDETLMSMGEILQLVPKIIVFEIFSPTISSQTFKNLLKLKFVNKLDIFKMFNLKYFEAILFCDFLKKNLDKSAKVGIRFHETFYQNREEYQKMKDTKPIFLKSLNENWSIEERPKVSFL